MRYADFMGNPKFATSVDGLYYDFNNGPRLLLPEGEYDVECFDLDNSMKFDRHIIGGGLVEFEVSKDYVKWMLVVKKDNVIIWQSEFNANNKNIHMDFIDGGKALGGVIDALVCVEEFRKQHKCNVYVTIQNEFVEILQRTYPKIVFVCNKEDDIEKVYDVLPKDIYATYYFRGFGIERKISGTYTILPVDWRLQGLPFYYSAKLKVECLQVPENYLLPSVEGKIKRIIPEPYVCVSGRGSTIFKEWNNEEGWVETVRYLKQMGYRVICIDGDGIEAGSPLARALEVGMEDFTGYRPLQERVDLLFYADFFIGISSGLSWLAWGTGKPVILISGFSLPFTEFYTPYRIINCEAGVCCGCHNDLNAWGFNNGLYEIYPCKNTDRYLECSRYIHANVVCKNIDKLMADKHLFPPVARESRM